jgi:hypothetical protein
VLMGITLIIRNYGIDKKRVAAHPKFDIVGTWRSGLGLIYD